MEETRKKNEASMARKRLNAKAINPAAANTGQGEGPVSPASTGAMDSLLEKLRAAAPQTKDTRDRRRRARLKDRHQIRVASGQPIPDIGDLTKGGSEDDEAEKTVLSPGSTKSSESAAADKSAEMATISEGEDIADRAASMLQGLRGDGEGSEPTPVKGDGSLRVRRRRESADDERRQRRRRRGAGSSSVTGEDKDPTLSPTGDPIPEEPPDGESTTPTTVVSPPSPEDTRTKPVVVDLSD